MNAPVDEGLLRQHLIDPEICIRCNTCEAICPRGAITHDSRNYVVKAEDCNFCMDCISPCPTGAIDNWRQVPTAEAYSIEAQLTWDELPAELPPEVLAQTRAAGAEGGEAGAGVGSGMGSGASAAAQGAETQAAAAAHSAESASATAGEGSWNAAQYGAQLPPWSAAHAYTQLYGPKAQRKTVQATVVGNVRVTQAGKEYDTHHIVLDFGSMPFPVLEGQSIGVIAPGQDAEGRAHHARQYSVASPRNGERVGYNNLSLTVKRVLEDHQGKPVRGVASNYLCDAQVGDKVDVIGPFGQSFLMPNHPRSNIIMICTGTGSAPMRAMTEWRRRLRQSGKFDDGKLMLFFGARTQEELPYFGPLQKLPKDFIDINFAYSRTSGQPKKYVQDAIRERAADVARLLQDENTFIYVCGLKAMEEGVMLALKDVAEQAGLTWHTLGLQLKEQGRLHLETY